jgi:hypothetical protein
MIVDGIPVSRYLQMGHHTAIGFPTKAQGGTIGSAHKPWDMLPPTIYPLRRDEGMPWVKPSALSAKMLYRDVDLGGGSNLGLGYCYRNIPIESLRSSGEEALRFSTRVDRVSIFGENTQGGAARELPGPFFENDEYLYLPEVFGLN